jgi:hypothetical protein
MADNNQDDETVADEGALNTGAFEAFIVERPLVALGVALAVGALLMRSLLGHRDR